MTTSKVAMFGLFDYTTDLEEKIFNAQVPIHQTLKDTPTNEVKENF
jgi:hypothetical protein